MQLFINLAVVIMLGTLIIDWFTTYKIHTSLAKSIDTLEERISNLENKSKEIENFK